MDTRWRLDASFRSLHLQGDIAALQSAPMTSGSFGPLNHATPLYPSSIRQQRFVVHRPVCYGGSGLGFFQLEAGAMQQVQLFEHAPWAASESTSLSLLRNRNISWLRGSTFAIGADNLHIPHFFFELQAMFSLGQYASSMVDRLLLVHNRGSVNKGFSQSDAGTIEHQFRPAKGSPYSFLEEMIMASMPHAAAEVEVLREDDRLLCFEQVVTLEYYTTYCTEKDHCECWIGYASVSCQPASGKSSEFPCSSMWASQTNGTEVSSSTDIARSRNEIKSRVSFGRACEHARIRICTHACIHLRTHT